MSRLSRSRSRTVQRRLWFIVTPRHVLLAHIDMTASDTPQSPLYQKLLGETAKIGWTELERFFARGMLLRVARDLDLVSVAEAIASDDATQVTQWLSAGLVERVQAETAADFAARDPELWAVVV